MTLDQVTNAVDKVKQGSQGMLGINIATEIACEVLSILGDDFPM